MQAAGTVRRRCGGSALGTGLTPGCFWGITGIGQHDLTPQHALGGCSPCSPARFPSASLRTNSFRCHSCCPAGCPSSATTDCSMCHSIFNSPAWPRLPEPIQRRALMLIAVLKIPAWLLMRAGGSARPSPSTLAVCRLPAVLWGYPGG